MIRTKDKADAGRPEADVSVIYTDKMKKAALTPLKAGKSAVQYTADAKRSLQKSKTCRWDKKLSDPADVQKQPQVSPENKDFRRSGDKVKTAGRAVRTNQNAVKTAERSAEAAGKYAEAARRSQRISKAVRGGTGKTKVAVRKTAEAAAKAIRAVKTSVTVLLAGGWIILAVVILISFTAAVFGSGFGIFYSGSDDKPISVIAAEIDADFNAELQRIQSSNKHDILKITGHKADWKETLAFFAVYAADSDSEAAQDVIELDEEKIKKLNSIFWEMNSIDYRTGEITETVTETVKDKNGKTVEKKKNVKRICLYINIRSKTADEMAFEYDFTDSQTQQLEELLSPEYDEMWEAVLSGVSDDYYGMGNGDIAAIARSQLGNTGGEIYWRWYGFETRTEWCACFVSWCADQCGYINTGVFPNFASCSQGIMWFQEHDCWRAGSYIPKRGDIIFFDWDNDGISDHVGIVERAENGTVYTIEGNSGDVCRSGSYEVGSGCIFGYGVPDY